MAIHPGHSLHDLNEHDPNCIACFMESKAVGPHETYLIEGKGIWVRCTGCDYARRIR